MEQFVDTEEAAARIVDTTVDMITNCCWLHRQRPCLHARERARVGIRAALGDWAKRKTDRMVAVGAAMH
eukprot:COSAG05_NODE_12083_length_484_cov_0.589610_1_plen_69_part_00